MNYKLHYDKLIERAKDRKLEGYTESHHVIPKCMNGNDDKDNLVRLTAREHFVAHILLVKIYPNEKGLINAVNMMCVNPNGSKDRVNNRMYGWLKEKFSERMSELQTGSNNSQFGTIWIYSLEEKISKKIGKNEIIPENWYKGRKFNFSMKKCAICDNEVLESNTKFCSKECKKISRLVYIKSENFVSSKGYKHTDESKTKMKKNKKDINAMWIYSLIKKESKKIKKEELHIYELQGWIKGRKMKF